MQRETEDVISGKGLFLGAALIMATALFCDEAPRAAVTQALEDGNLAVLHCDRQCLKLIDAEGNLIAERGEDAAPDARGIDKLHLQEGHYRILYRDCSSLTFLPDVESWRTVHVKDGKTYVVESSEVGEYNRFVCHDFSIHEASDAAR